MAEQLQKQHRLNTCARALQLKIPTPVSEAKSEVNLLKISARLSRFIGELLRKPQHSQRSSQVQAKEHFMPCPAC